MMMTKIKLLLKILFLYAGAIVFIGCVSQEGVGNSKSSEESQIKVARVVGYLPTYSFGNSGQIDYCKLTHLNLAFANPDADGNLHIDEDIDAIIKEAQALNPSLVICISLAGGVMTEEHIKNWSNLIDIPANRPSFINKILTFIQNHNLHGVDVDLEWDNVTIGYSGFVTELKIVLNKHNKIMTAALPNNSRFENISNEALNSFDFINIMSYDRRGPWTSNDPGQHSSSNNSKEGIKFWKDTYGVPKHKLTLGVPFYGYNFTNNEITSITYAQVVAAGTEFADKDELGKIYYNGRPTIEAKVQLASNEVGGIMIWELGQDSFGEYSLLNTIHKKFTNLGVKTTGLCGN